jgi:hypothetical protein
MAWAGAMRSIALKGVLMPQAVAKELGMAIYCRSQSNGFFAQFRHGDPQKHANHVHVCELLRSFQRLFKHATPDDQRKVIAQQAKQNLGFAVLCDEDEVDQDSATEEDDSVKEEGAGVEAKASLETEVHEQEDEETFANACLLKDMHTIRQDIRKLWAASDAPSAASLLSLACGTSYRIKMAAAVVSSTTLCCPAINLASLVKTCTPGKQCKHCSKILISSLRCSRCKSAVYCSRDCQRVHWKEHRSACGADAKKEDAKNEVQPVARGLGTLKRLLQIQSALSGFDHAAIPGYCAGLYEDESGGTGNMVLTPEAQTLSMAALMDIGINTASSFEEVLRLFFSTHFMLWMAHTDLPVSGAIDSTIRTYLREFRRTKEPTLELAFVVLVILDNISSGCAEADEVVSGALADVLEAGAYEQYDIAATDIGKLWLPPDAKASLRNKGQNHYRLLCNLHHESRVYSHVCPWFGGELMLMGLRLAFVNGISLIYADIVQFIISVHVYWVLRSLGFLHSAPEVDQVIGCYREHVLFRGGLPNTGGFQKSQQLAMGMSVAVVRNSRTDKAMPTHTKATTRKHPEHDRTGQHATEISRLLYIAQYDEPGANAEETLRKIPEAAEHDLTNVLKAPIFTTGLGLARFRERLAGLFCDEAREMVGHITTCVDGGPVGDLEMVASYIFLCADEAPAAAKRDLLSRVADCFREEFSSSVSSAPIIAARALKFSPYDHKVDPSFTGDKPAFSGSYASASDRKSGPVKMDLKGTNTGPIPQVAAIQVRV